MSTWLVGICLAAVLAIALWHAQARSEPDESETEPSGDTRPPVDIRILESPDARAKAVVEFYGEHHMGCEHVVIRPGRGFEGCTSLQGTNAGAFFGPAGRLLIVHDANLVLALDFDTGRARHLRPPEGWYFTDVRLEKGTLHADLYDSGSGRQSFGPVDLDAGSSPWQPGLGLETPGRLPSAYGPPL